MTDFIVDILVGSTQSDIRDTALEQFYLLAQTDTMPLDLAPSTPSPQAFMLTTLLKARLPFWVTASSTRGPGFRFAASLCAVVTLQGWIEELDPDKRTIGEKYFCFQQFKKIK